MKSFTERNPLIIGIIVVALIAAGTGAALLLNGGVLKDRRSVLARFPDAAGLRKGDKVRVAGVPVGEVAAVRQRGSAVEIELQVDRDVDLPKDTKATIAVETLLGSKSVRLEPGRDWNHLLPAGATITDTETPTELLDVQNIGTPVLEDLDGKAIDELMGRLSTISEGQREDVANIIEGLDDLTTAVNTRQEEARRLIESANTLSATLADRDQDLLASLDEINVVLGSLADRRTQLLDLIDQTVATMTSTGDLLEEKRPEIDAMLNSLHQDLDVIGRRQKELSASLATMANAISGFASIGYSGPDNYPNTWANMYAQMIGPIGPDALLGSCGLLDDALDLAIGPDPITDCSARTGPLPSETGNAPAGSGSLADLYGPLLEGS